MFIKNCPRKRRLPSSRLWCPAILKRYFYTSCKWSTKEGNVVLRTSAPPSLFIFIPLLLWNRWLEFNEILMDSLAIHGFISFYFIIIFIEIVFRFSISYNELCYFWYMKTVVTSFRNSSDTNEWISINLSVFPSLWFLS